MRDIPFEGFRPADIVDIAAHYSQGIPAFPARRPLERFLTGIAVTPTVDFMAIGTPNAVTFDKLSVFVHIDSRRACDDDHALSLSLGLVGRLRELKRQIKLPEDSNKIELRFIHQEELKANPEKYGNIAPAFMNDIASLRDFVVMYRDPTSDPTT